MAAAAGDAPETARAAAWMLRLADDPYTLAHAAELYLAAGDAPKAAEVAAEALEADPALPEAWRVGGLAAAAAGDPDTALARLEHVRGAPGVEAARLAILVERRDPSGAAELGAWVPEVPEDRLAAARLRGRLGDHRAAVELALALGEDPVVGAAALELAVAESAAACDLGPLGAWAAARPSLVLPPAPPLDPAACDTGDP